MSKLYKREQEILDALRSAGPDGLTIKQIAGMVRRSETVVHKWIFYLGPERDNVVEFDKTKRPAIYKLRRFRAG